MGTHVYKYAGGLNEMDETRERKGDSLLTVGARMFTLESDSSGSNLNTHKGLICTFSSGTISGLIMMNV